MSIKMGPSKKNTCVKGNPTLPDLLVKPRIFPGFLEKNRILCILKSELPFKMHKIIFYPK